MKKIDIANDMLDKFLNSKGIEGTIEYFERLQKIKHLVDEDILNLMIKELKERFKK